MAAPAGPIVMRPQPRTRPARSSFGHIFAASYRCGARGDKSPFEGEFTGRHRRGRCFVGVAEHAGYASSRRRQDLMRRSLGRKLVLAALAVATAVPGVSAQEADGRWWEAIPGFGRSESQPRRTSDEDPRRRPEVIDDLRPDATPLRSDVMIGALEGAIQRYQRIVANGGWPTIPGNRMIRPEDNDERMPLLRHRLMLSGELSRRQSEGFGFGDDVDAAVRRFQFNHGLRITGRVDKPTLLALNVPAQARLAQLRTNQQRLRELTAQRIEDRYVLVNVAAFQLEAVERHQVELRHRVIAGKPERQTPSVRATIKALNFFPYWRVPERVAAPDLNPRLCTGPDYPQTEQIRVT